MLHSYPDGFAAHPEPWIALRARREQQFNGLPFLLNLHNALCHRVNRSRDVLTTNNQPAKVARRYPGARIILAHAGGFMPYGSLRLSELAHVTAPMLRSRPTL
jgi:hypothetical protein